VADGMNKSLKRMAAPLWEKVLDRGPALSGLLDKRSSELKARQLNAPLSPTPDSYLFYLCDDANVRVPLSYSGNWHRPGGVVETLSVDELRRRVREKPEIVSPKAALRPLYQDFVLPTVAYVAGPTELDYHAQIAPFYGELGVPAPVLFSRLSATLVDARTARSASKLGKSWEDLLGQDASSLSRDLADQQDEGRTAIEFDAVKQSIEVLYERLASSLAALDPTLRGAARTSAGRSLNALDQLREKAERALGRKHADVLTWLNRVLAAVRPQGELSERVFCTGCYLARYGPERLLAALDSLPVEAREHMTVEL